MPVTLADGGGNAFHSRVFLFSPPWHRRTGWTRTACCSGGDLRVTRAASPRSAWVKRTEQVMRGEGGLRRMLDICHLLIISVRLWQVVVRGARHGVGARLQPLTPAVIPANLYATDVGCLVNVRHLLSPTWTHCFAVLRAFYVELLR